MNTSIQPVTRFTRWQVADMLNVSLTTVNLYTSRGKKITNDLFIKLPKRSDGYYHLPDIERFLEEIKK